MTEEENLSFSKFLSDTPPQTPENIGDLGYFESHWNFTLNKPTIEIHCENEKCLEKGLLTFRCLEAIQDNKENCHRLATYRYLCPNCRALERVFSLVYALEDEKSGTNNNVVCIKLGQYPNFGPPVPARLIKAIGPDRDLFLKGRRCENQGLGVGAFSYYRRVIENQKDRLFDQAIKITNLVEPNSPLVAELESAKNETQFTKSVDTIKTALPQTLLINGSNPLTLLHSALSEGLHAKTDAECLEFASMIRTILTEYSKKVASAINDNKELTDAVTKLNQMRKK